MSDFGMKLDVINEDDIVIDTMSSQKIHKAHLLHRSVHIIVQNYEKEIYVRRRSDHLELYPGVWTSSVGEHVFVGEYYEQAAQKALEGFLGLDTSLVFVGKQRVEDAIENELMGVFLSFSNKIPYLNPEHSESGAFLSLEKVKTLIQNGRTTPHLAAAIKIVLQQKGEGYREVSLAR